MSEEKVLTLRGKKAVWAPGGGSGPIDPSRLPEGYPYKEQSETEIALWKDFLFETQSGERMQFQGPIDELLVAGQKYLVVLDGEKYTVEAAEVSQGSMSMTFISDVDASDMANATFLAYSTTMPNSAFAMIFSVKPTETNIHTVEVYKLSETIHLMAEEFLPAGVGGGVQVVEFTANDDGSLTSSYTGAEIAQMAQKGQVLAHMTTDASGDTWLNFVSFSPTYGAAFLMGIVMTSPSPYAGVGIMLVPVDSKDVVNNQIGA